ncbi:MAG: hypothetical protein ACRDJN_03160 [Chloroflexota bacterium]
MLNEPGLWCQPRISVLALTPRLTRVCCRQQTVRHPLLPRAGRGNQADGVSEHGRNQVAERSPAVGDVQPLDMPWKFQGMGNNMVQRVDVPVE